MIINRAAITALMACCLVACNRGDADNGLPPDKSMSSISGYNYTMSGIQEFYVDGAWGSGISIGGGGGMVCCVLIPEKWSPELRITVEWERSDCGPPEQKNINCPRNKLSEWKHKTLKKTVPIEPYDRPNTVQVMFLPKDEIKVYVSPMDPDHPNHPAKLGFPHPLDNPNWKSPYR